ncbi:putative membrane protein [Reichenbachiella faecimaris]|uniref:Putative membrane protein n=1 Tax=Reichenbachiella faecimaris TaxID=692418 RepID=A0A1W2G792_REIFA|nr:PH domain-containing protein [Reichenbachiella faecimaris]SMD32549.1 putative membrane protein [Reichenbachiella faecimaris]
MSKSTQPLLIAAFSPNIKLYTLLIVSFFITLSVFGIVLLPIWFLGLGQYISRRYYESLSCSLTSHHLQFKKGVMFKVEKTIPLENIQDLTFIENPLLKMLQLKILKIETASQGHPMKSDMQLVGIIEAGAFKDAVLAQREKLSNRKSSEDLTKESSEVVSLLRDIKGLLQEMRSK